MASDSIADIDDIENTVNGPQRVIYDGDYEDLFDILIENSEDVNLGLDDTHVVEAVIL